MWAVRVYKTRSLATSACQGGHVRVNGAPAKPATKVRVGDTVTARAGDDDRVLDAALRFVAQRGQWRPSNDLAQRIDDAALGMA